MDITNFSALKPQHFAPIYIDSLLSLWVRSGMPAAGLPALRSLEGEGGHLKPFIGLRKFYNA